MLVSRGQCSYAHSLPQQSNYNAHRQHSLTQPQYSPIDYSGLATDVCGFRTTFHRWVDGEYPTNGRCFKTCPRSRSPTAASGQSNQSGLPPITLYSSGLGHLRKSGADSKGSALASARDKTILQLHAPARCFIIAITHAANSDGSVGSSQ